MIEHFIAGFEKEAGYVEKIVRGSPKLMKTIAKSMDRSVEGAKKILRSSGGKKGFREGVQAAQSSSIFTNRAAKNRSNFFKKQEGTRLRDRVGRALSKAKDTALYSPMGRAA